jgi:hypothetical protein
MTGNIAATMPALQGPVPDVRVERSRTDLRRFAVLVVQLALLLVVFKGFGLEQRAFLTLAYLMFGGFAVSYWLPFRFKEAFFIVFSLAGTFALLSPVVAAMLITTGFVVFAVVRSSLSFWWKVITLLALLCVFAYGRATGALRVPGDFWPVFGAVFMFRMIVYLYDVKHMREKPGLKDFLNYFFLLPNYYFLLFPVIDFQTMRQSYFKRDIHSVAQQGVWWILRGTTHLLLYRLIYQLQAAFSPPQTPVALAVPAKMALCYLLYLRVSGQFHIIVGMLHLFGFDLPETNRRYLLANGIEDFWRRINIYWKDFMVKIFYYPVYFKLRRRGDLRAKLLATALVFVATWFLHAYQFFWLQGKFRVTLNDSLFWTSLAVLFMTSIWMDSLRGKRKRKKTGLAVSFKNALQIAATFALISVLWSMWSADSLPEWLYFLKSGNI